MKTIFQMIKIILKILRRVIYLLWALFILGVISGVFFAIAMIFFKITLIIVRSFL
jgi:hypothetical protein